MSGVREPESLTIRRLVIPRLRAAGWSERSWTREYVITGEPRTVVDGRVRRGRPLRADFALHHGEHPIGAVEAKRSLRSVRDGVQQARDYAGRLDLPIAYATNGDRIIEINMRDQSEREVDRFRSPEELWEFFREEAGLTTDLAVSLFTTPYTHQVTDAQGVPKALRYYQHVALQRILRRLAAGDQRLLAVLATGSGKTNLAMQLVHVLWQNHWPRGPASLDDRPRVLYLADRDALLKQPMRDWFRPAFGDEPIQRVRGAPTTAKHLYFASYQALDQGGRGDREELFRQYDRDFFDLVVVDECHRGSAAASSAWREVLDHFGPAVQLGLTATPRVEGEIDTYAYFGQPVYVYSLKQGVEDGFLAPFEVVRVRLDIDIDGVVIPEGMRDRTGQPVPAGSYGVPQFERVLHLPERTHTAARYLTDFLRGRDPMGKTIVFCVNQEHASVFREEMVNLNSDLMRAHGEWVVRITADEGERGVVLLDQFQDPDQPTPVVVTTSRLLSTGVDVPTVRTIVLFRRIDSMIEFKQIIGRGSRLDPERDKEYFTVVDFTGATRKFEDRDFDGPPIRVVTQDPLDEPPAPPGAADEPVDDALVVAEPEAPYAKGDPQPDGAVPDDGSGLLHPDDEDAVVRRSRRYVVDGVDVHVASEAVYVVDTETGRLRMIRYEQWVRDRVLAMDIGPASLRAQWATVKGRRELRALLKETLAFDIGTLATRLNRPECDPIDLLIWLAWDLPLLSRRQRVDWFTRHEREFLDRFPARARQILASMLDKYAANGPDDLSPAALHTQPFTDMGRPAELAAEFGGPAGLHRAIDDLGTRLLAAA